MTNCLILISLAAGYLLVRSALRALRAFGHSLEIIEDIQRD